MYLDRLALIGFAGGDAETKNSSNGSTFTVLSVPTKRSWKNADGEWESRTEWHRCIRKTERIRRHLKKGSHVHVEGELRTRRTA